jgi:tRNA(Ile)-lysidine synthase TilS/MesJ
MIKISIARPPWTGIGKKLESATRKALFDFHMLQQGPKVAVALSGGKDSLALLFLLKAISGRGFPELDLHAIHIHGEFSCGAGVHLEYLQEICQQMDIKFISRASTQKLDSLECYGCSRERRSLLFNAAKEVGAKTIAFGHHRDDNAQTVLMNLLHKGEFAGMLPKLYMHEYGITIIRPLTYITENDVRTFAAQHEFLRVMCKCPVGQNSLRKKTDHLLSEIEDIFPNARANIAEAGLKYGSDKASRP